MPNFDCSALFAIIPTKVAQNNLEGLILPILHCFQSLSTTDMDLIQEEDNPDDSCAISPTAFLFHLN